MLPAPMQPILDDYVTGRIDEATFLSRTDWAHTWGFPFAQYRPLFDTARRLGLRAYALNAAPELPRALAQRGLSGLSAEQRQQLPEMVPGPAPHRAQLEAAFEAHPGVHPRIHSEHGISDGKTGAGSPDAARETLERFYLAQLAWDETMAEQIHRALSAPGAPRQLLVVLGAGHARRFAVPQRLARRQGRTVRDVVLLVDALEPPTPGALPLAPVDAATDEETGEGADFVVELPRIATPTPPGHASTPVSPSDAGRR
jgi:hypothetical protein